MTGRPETIAAEHFEPRLFASENGENKSTGMVSRGDDYVSLPDVGKEKST